LALTLALTLSLPTLAAHHTVFSDVPTSSWFAEPVAICTDANLMNGTDRGVFSPEIRLTEAECLTLAARIHNVVRGGNGALSSAPANWGRFTLTTSDGTTQTGYLGDGIWSLIHLSKVDNGHVCRTITSEAEKIWAECQTGQPATFQLEDKTSTGTVVLSGNFFYFEPAYYTDLFDFIRQSYYCPAPNQGQWYRNACWYAVEHGLAEKFASIFGTGGAATRQEFAASLTVASTDLTPINTITALPDTDDKDILTLYNAGILTGTDAYGTFAGVLPLTRAEAAAMAARVLRPDIRLTFTPENPTYVPYTLTELPIDGWTADSSWVSQNLLMLQNSDGSALLHIDGTLLPLPEGTAFSGWNPSVPFIILEKQDSNQAFHSLGIMDGNTGEMILPFGPYEICDITSDGYFITRRYSCSESILWDRKGNQLAVLSDDGPQWYRFCEGLAPCQDSQTGLYGYTNAIGAWTIPPQWIWANGFQDGYAIVSSQTGSQIIDQTGKVLLTSPYDDLHYQGGGWFRHTDRTTGDSFWLRPDGTMLQNGWLMSDITCTNGFFPCGHCYLTDRFAPATPRIFDWTGPVGPNGSAFAGKDGTIYSIQF
jgi:hypothetical protein